jgi:hypothetical protein
MQKLNTTMSNNSVSETNKQIITDDTEKKPMDIPVKSIYAYDLKKLKSYRNIRKGVKLSNQLIIFENDVGCLLKCFDIDQFIMSSELLELIIQLCEDYFVYGSKKERDDVKKQAIDSLMLKYFKYDQALLDIMVTYAFTKVKKTTFIKRVYCRLVAFLKKRK